MIKASTVNLPSLQNETLLEDLPEIYKLRQVIENSKTSHKNDSVFDHTLRCWEKIEEFLANTDKYVNKYLDQKIDQYTRRQVFLIGVLFHDIGKKETILTENGFTKCPKHAEVGAKKAIAIINRFDLSSKEKKQVIDLIKYHLVPFFIVTSTNQNIDEQISSMKKDHPDIFIELLLLGFSDILGNQLKLGNRKEFNFCTEYYQKLLNNLQDQSLLGNQT